MSQNIRGTRGEIGKHLERIANDKKTSPWIRRGLRLMIGRFRRSKTVRRRWIEERLWPGSSGGRKAARNNFAQLLFQINRKLETMGLSARFSVVSDKRDPRNAVVALVSMSHSPLGDLREMLQDAKRQLAEMGRRFAKLTAEIRALRMAEIRAQRKAAKRMVTRLALCPSCPSRI